MKLRVKNNSIRLRLTQTEVRRFEETGSVEERIEFAAAAYLTYQIKSTEAQEINAIFEDGKITIFVPVDAARAWTDSAAVGLENKQTIGDGKALKILIEKDFACLERTDGEDETDAFPHPAGRAAC